VYNDGLCYPQDVFYNNIMPFHVISSCCLDVLYLRNVKNKT